MTQENSLGFVFWLEKIYLEMAKKIFECLAPEDQRAFSDDAVCIISKLDLQVPSVSLETEWQLYTGQRWVADPKCSASSCISRLHNMGLWRGFSWNSRGSAGTVESSKWHYFPVKDARQSTLRCWRTFLWLLSEVNIYRHSLLQEKLSWKWFNHGYFCPGATIFALREKSWTSLQYTGFYWESHNSPRIN